LPAADTETAPSVLWSAAIKGIKRKQVLANLAIESLAGQIGETQKGNARAQRRFGD
jgi:hypothetical protein